jgi:hypothetical protein
MEACNYAKDIETKQGKYFPPVWYDAKEDGLK